VEYLPFGEVWIEETDPATGYIPFRFTSKELDEETGLYYYGARYYEPTISRWMSADPAGFALVNPMERDDEGGWKPKASYSIIEAANWYAYVSNNPVIYVDPTGMADIIAYVEGEAVLGFGFGADVSFGIVIDTDDLYDSGINVTGGVVGGASAGVGAGFAFLLREAEGSGWSYDINAGGYSISIYFDDQGPNGFGVTIGPGAGVAVTRTESITLSIEEMGVVIYDVISFANSAIYTAAGAINSIANRFFNLFLPTGPHRSPLGSRNEN